jgi:hypothetical protein
VVITQDGIAVDSLGNLFVLNQDALFGQSIVSINPTSGLQSALSIEHARTE